MDKALHRKIISKYRRDVARLSSLLPSTQLTLEDLYRGARDVRLHSGDTHIIDEEDARRLLETVPQYFWNLMKVPIVFKYVKYEDGTRKYIVSGDVWQKRLVEILITGDYSATGITEIEVDDFLKLLAWYRSIIFVSITL